MADNLPTWDQMSETDQSRALQHIWKTYWDDPAYAREHYPAEYVDHPALTALDPAIRAMTDKGLTTLVVLAPDYWDIEDAFGAGDYSQIAWRLKEIHRALYRPMEHTAVVIDLGGGTITNATPKLAWEAK